jgi:hypothetical protein
MKIMNLLKIKMVVLDIKTTEIILKNTVEVEEFNASNLENNNQQINEL